mgnify:CR=1 FL=1
MDYNKMLQYHKEKDAACTIAMLEVPWEEASRFGLMFVDDDGKITAFEEKPKVPKSTLASMGIYVFSADKLCKYLFRVKKYQHITHIKNNIADHFCAPFSLSTRPVLSARSWNHLRRSSASANASLAASYISCALSTSTRRIFG